MDVVAVSSPFSYLSIIFVMASNRLGDSGLPLVSHDMNINTMQSNRTQSGFRKGTSILEREENRITALIMDNSIPPRSPKMSQLLIYSHYFKRTDHPIRSRRWLFLASIWIV